MDDILIIRGDFMEGFFSSIIPIIVLISIIAKIIDATKKNQQKSDKGIKQSNNRQQSLQSLIRDQVTQHKDSLLDQFNNIANFDNDNTRYKEGDKLNRNTLEGTPVEHQSHERNGKSYNEGDKLHRDTLEGITLEDIEDSMSLDALNLDDSDVLKVSKIRKSKTNKPKKHVGASYRGLKLNQENIVNGIIISEVLVKRGGRR
jgi:hypothetical protein